MINSNHNSTFEGDYHNPMSETHHPIDLPELRQADIDDETLDQLFSDIAEQATLLEVIPKAHDESFISSNRISLPEARLLLENAKVKEVQVRYCYKNAEWWDTIMITPDAYKIIRMKHEMN